MATRNSRKGTMTRPSWIALGLTLAAASFGCEDSSSNGSLDGGPDAAGGLIGQTPDGGAKADGAGAMADGAGADLAPGQEPLTATRRTSYRRITNFQRGPEAKFLSDAKISADGTTVIFGTSTGTYTIAADGTKMVQLSDKGNGGLVDISADGKKVVWFDGAREGYVAGSDGSGKVKLPGAHAVGGVRMTAAGDQIYQVSGEGGGILKLPADGSGMAVIMTTADVAKLNGVDANGNHWRGVIDISDDGSKVVFSFLWDAFSMTGEGAGLKQHTQFLMPENRTLKLVRISGNGAKMAWNVEDGVKSAVTIQDFGGGNRLEYLGFNYSSGSWLRLSGDATSAVLGWGIRLLDTAKLRPYDAIDAGSGSVPLGRPAMVTLTRDGRRACLVVEGQESTDQGRPNQIVIVDFDPPTTNGAPTIEGTATNLRAVPIDGTKRSSVFAVVKDAEVTEVHAVALRDGFRLAGGVTPWLNWALGDTGMNGDVTAKDQT